MTRWTILTAIFCFVSLAGCEDASNYLRGKTVESAKTQAAEATSNAFEEVKGAVESIRFKLDGPLKVGITSFVPNVILTGDKPAGFDIELWEKIAALEGWEYEYVEFKEFGDLIPSVVKGDIDIAIAGIFITEEREALVDFSHQYKYAGLNILINKRLVTPPAWKILWQPDMMRSFGSFLIVLLVFGFLIWQVEKRSKDGNVKHFKDGVSLSFANKSTIGWGNFFPTTWAGLGLSVLMFFMGTIFVGDVISTMGAIKTKQVLDTNIQSAADLSGKTVATVAGTAAVKSLEERHAIVVLSNKGRKICDIEEAYPLLEDGTVDAVVFDAPPIEYFLKQGGDKDYIVVGGSFDNQEYGIAMQQGSQLRERINRALLQLRKGGQYDKIHNKWFGE